MKIELTKRQYTESRKRYELIHDLLSEKADIKETGISYKKGQIYFCDGYKEYIIATFWDYKSLKQAQDYLIALLQTIDVIVSHKLEDLLYKMNRKGA